MKEELLYEFSLWKSLMKCVVMAALNILLLSPVVNAMGINMLSEKHHVWGTAGESFFLYPFLEYDKIGDQPISISVSGEYYNPWSHSPNPCASSAVAGNFAIEVLAMYDSTANAYSTYTFTPEYDQLSFSTVASMQYILPSTVSFTLNDLTDKVTLLSKKFTSYWDENGWQEHFTFSQEFEVSSNHVYQLSLFASASEGPMADGGTSEWKHLQCFLSSQLQPVPEPETALLFTFGLLIFTSKPPIPRRHNP